MEKSYSSLKVLLKVFMFSAVSMGSSTRSVLMTFLYPGPAFSISPRLLDVPAASSGAGYWAPASTSVFSILHLDPGS
jgi:hypothetical protein